MIKQILPTYTMRLMSVVSVAGFLFVPLLTTFGDNEQLAPASTPESVAAGRDVFFEYCSGCHGRRADGRGPQSLNLVPRPQNLRNAQFVRYLTDERLYSSVSGGVRGTSMPAFELTLSPEKRWQVIHYIRSLTADDTIRIANGPAHQPVSADLKNPVEMTQESVERGRARFNNYCASCHGTRADGLGRVAASLTPAPRNLVIITSFGEKPFVDYLADSRLFDSITNGVPGTSMAPWINVLTEGERWDIVNFLRSEADGERRRVETAYQ
jgi:mono/diheme cytochrome c family protein